MEPPNFHDDYNNNINSGLTSEQVILRLGQQLGLLNPGEEEDSNFDAQNATLPDNVPEVMISLSHRFLIQLLDRILILYTW